MAIKSTNCLESFVKTNYIMMNCWNVAFEPAPADQKCWYKVLSVTSIVKSEFLLKAVLCSALF